MESQQVVEGATYGMVLPFKQVTVSFHNVRYFVPIPEVRPQVTLGKVAVITELVRALKTRAASTPYTPTIQQILEQDLYFLISSTCGARISVMIVIIC